MVFEGFIGLTQAEIFLLPTRLAWADTTQAAQKSSPGADSNDPPFQLRGSFHRQSSVVTN